MQLSWATTNARATVTLQRVHSASVSVMCELPVLYLESRGQLIKWAVSWEILIPSHLPRRGRSVGNRAGHAGPFLPFLCVGQASFQLHCESCRKGEAFASELPIAQRGLSRSGFSITRSLYAVIWCHLCVPDLSLGSLGHEGAQIV